MCKSKFKENILKLSVASGDSFGLWCRPAENENDADCVVFSTF